MTSLLVVAGEASGDLAAAGVVAELQRHLAVRAWGMGGSALEAVGVDLVATVKEVTALGIGEVARRACRIATARKRLLAAMRRAPQAALLVNYTEFNAHLAPVLRARGVRVLWYGAPQIWAWRPNRARELRRFVDRMAVMLPFEEPLWRKQGLDAHYVGHPIREVKSLDRDAARRALDMTLRAEAIAILPGSRPHEVRRLLRPMLEAYSPIRRDRASVDARVLLATSLDPSTIHFATLLAAQHRVPVHFVEARYGASPVLAAFDVALCASGTAALEAAAARVAPVVVYRVGFMTEMVARMLVRTPHIALPNVLLRRRAFTELVQRDVQPHKIAVALTRALVSKAALQTECDAVLSVLGEQRTPSREVARMIAPWLERPHLGRRFGVATTSP